MTLRWKCFVVVLASMVAVSAGMIILDTVGLPVHPVVAAALTVGFVAMVLMAAYKNYVDEPLRRIIRGAGRLAEGDGGHRIELPKGDEMAAIADALNDYAERVAEARSRLETKVAERTADLRAVIVEVHERSRLVEEVNRRLADLNRRRSEFLTNVSHEIRTPLNAIMGYLKLLLDDMYEDEAERREFLGNARLSTSHLLKLVNDVLSATQLDTGSLKVRLAAFHPGDVVQEVLQIVRAIAREKDIALRFEVEGSAMVFADIDKVRQVLINLVSNALKFTDTGEIVIRTRACGEAVRFEVRDTGIGIPPGELEQIFDKFHQASKDGRWSGGAGLGLSIARNLVQLMGGTITAHSEGPGTGATFRFSLPSASAEYVAKTLEESVARAEHDGGGGDHNE